MASRRPRLVTNLPGPRAQALVARDGRCLSPSFTRPYPAAIAKGEGVWVTDVDGNELLDMTAGIAVCATGHCHPQVVQAIQGQAARLIHMSGTDFYYEPEVALAEKLSALAPTGSDNRVFFGNSGAEAIEGSIKLARYATKRPYLLAFFGAFHGRTLGALSLTASQAMQRRSFAPLLTGVAHAPYPYCYRCPLQLEHPSCDLACLKYIEEVLFQTVLPPEEVAAIVVEPIQGEGGYIVPPADYFPRLWELARKYGILMVADEIQTGLGRTGKMFALEHWGVRPDILALGKGIASGLPLSAFIAEAKLMSWPPGSHGSTFGGNPISCAAALATLELIQGGLMDNAARIGETMLSVLREIQERHPLIGEVRGKGLMLGIELVKDKKSRERNQAARTAIVKGCFQRGLLILGAGPTSIRLCPALIISEAEAQVGLELFEDALSAVEREGASPL